MSPELRLSVPFSLSVFYFRLMYPFNSVCPALPFSLLNGSSFFALRLSRGSEERLEAKMGMQRLGHRRPGGGQEAGKSRIGVKVGGTGGRNASSGRSLKVKQAKGVGLTAQLCQEVKEASNGKHGT